MSERFPFRPATLEERREFYEKEFSMQKVKEWFKKNGMPLPQICALDAGSETGIILDKKLKGIMIYFPFSELKKKIEKYIPEDVYYERNVYKNPRKTLERMKFSKWERQELVFDIDSDNIKCDHGKREDVCEKCLGKAYLMALKMKKDLKKHFRKIKLVYSGRGFHLHVLDEKARNMKLKEREKIVRKFSGYPIDEWVSRGNVTLIRMPYSLNGLVSRKATPINKKINTKKIIPAFLKN